MGASFMRNRMLVLLTIGLCGCASTGQGGSGRAGSEASDCVKAFDDPHAGIAAAAGLFICPVEAIVAAFNRSHTPPPVSARDETDPAQ